MKTEVTEQGVLIPRQWLEGVNEVELRRGRNVILVLPVGTDDPVSALGSHPLDGDLADASSRHDAYTEGGTTSSVTRTNPTH